MMASSICAQEETKAQRRSDLLVYLSTVDLRLLATPNKVVDGRTTRKIGYSSLSFPPCHTFRSSPDHLDRLGPPGQHILHLHHLPQGFARRDQSVNTDRMIGHVVIDVRIHRGG
jgi:hypothetical protein